MYLPFRDRELGADLLCRLMPDGTAKVLPETELDALLNYYASQQN